MAERFLSYRVGLEPETESARVLKLVGTTGIPAASMTALEVVASMVRTRALLVVLGDASAGGRRSCGLRTTSMDGPQGGRTKDTNIGRADRKDRVLPRSPATCAKRMAAGGAGARTTGEPALWSVLSCRHRGEESLSQLCDKHRGSSGSFLDFVHQPRELVSAEAEETLTWAEKGRPLRGWPVPTLLEPKSGRWRSVPGQRGLGAGSGSFWTCRGEDVDGGGDGPALGFAWV